MRCVSFLFCDSTTASCCAECTGCLECLAVRQAKNTLTMSLPLGLRKRRAVPAWSIAAGIAILLLGITGYSKVTALEYESTQAGLFTTRNEGERTGTSHAGRTAIRMFSQRRVACSGLDSWVRSCQSAIKPRTIRFGNKRGAIGGAP